MFDIADNPLLAWFFTFFAIPYGAMFGSFLNMAIYRVPRRISMFRVARSFCPNCKNTIRWYHNIPILSYMQLRGRCAYCSWSIPGRYLLVELLSTTGCLLIAFHTLVLNPVSLGWWGLALFIIVWLCFLAIIFVDMELYLIPDLFTHLPLALGLIFAVIIPDIHYAADPWFSAEMRHAAQFNALADSLLGAATGALLTWALGAVGTLYKRVEAMGEGDVLLMAAIGSLLGWKLALLNLILASFAGAIFGLLGMLFSKLRQGTTEKTITFEDTVENLEKGEPFHIALIRRLGERGMGIILTGLFGACWLYGMHRLNQDVWMGDGQGYNYLMISILALNTLMGGFMIMYGFYKSRQVKSGLWIEHDVEKTEDGKVKESMTGHYMPFGPMLAASAMVLLIWGPLAVDLCSRYYLNNEKPPVQIKTPFTSKRNAVVQQINNLKKYHD